MKKNTSTVLLLLVVATFITVHVSADTLPLLEERIWLPLVMGGTAGVVTPTPTLLPTITPTPTPRPTATSTPTPTPSGVHVLPNHSAYVVYDYLLIVGEVQNDTPNYLRFVKIAANVFNQSGQLLDTDYTYAYLGVLAPGEKTCFKVWFFDTPVGWSYYTFEQPTYWTDASPPPNLAIFNTSGSYDPVYGDYKILGQVRNDHSGEVRYVSPIGTLYNHSGTVVDCDYAYVNSTHLAPGQTSSFEIWFYGRGYADVRSYQVQVDCDS